MGILGSTDTDYCISGIVCERKLLRYVDCHSACEKTFTNLVIQLVIQLCTISFEKK